MLSQVVVLWIVNDVDSFYVVSEVTLQVGFGTLWWECESLAIEVIGGLAGHHLAFNVVVYHEADWNFVGDPLRLAFRGRGYVYDVPYKMLVLLQIRLDVNSKLYRVLWFYHHYAEAIEVIKVLLDKIKAAEATKYVVNR